ncbi:hypothetical protein GGTG_11295 [Gaeumannomyces tritici R3-111a-1]|uniref:Uncharacterized protein n=1 Tax=Gaeumannomyces tritici (strain R3-111a-1) TaxID=644352 RepID=J3PCS7_GAET3|nr:hypothetical protein GGTG_11295 [Gaeumannomyces tritici R3-111a-1]EJT72047.1 hypothetical protein GGTG_11295 [Gaeumannomyces tritici R3-111a-1]
MGGGVLWLCCSQTTQALSSVAQSPSTATANASSEVAAAPFFVARQIDGIPFDGARPMPMALAWLAGWLAGSEFRLRETLIPHPGGRDPLPHGRVRGTAAALSANQATGALSIDRAAVWRVRQWRKKVIWLEAEPGNMQAFEVPTAYERNTRQPPAWALPVDA